MKQLIAYYSRTGNTRVIAEMIQKLTDGDLFENGLI
jgi:flavodoxin